MSEHEQPKFLTCGDPECHTAHDLEFAVVIDRVVALWNNSNGWIPGAAYRELAEALGVSTDRLMHYDREAKRQVGPVDHYHRAGLSVLDGAAVYGQCIVWVDGVRCEHDVRVR